MARGGTTPPWHEWQYVKVGRLFPYVEESIDHGTQCAVFEPNEEPLSEVNKAVNTAPASPLVVRAGAATACSVRMGGIAHSDRN